MLSTRSIAVASVLLAVAGRTLAFPHAVPSTLLRTRSTWPTSPDHNGSCEYISEWAQLCPTGGCCEEGSFCQATDEEGTIFVCATDREIPGSTPPTPDDNGVCPANSTLCPTGGCCATECLATDAEGTIFVCAPPSAVEPEHPVGNPPIPDDNGVCPADDEFAQLCAVNKGCCPSGTMCLEDGDEFVCGTDRTIPGSTPPIPDDNGVCYDNFELCPTGGCCATQCLATDVEGTIFVCAPHEP